MLRHTRTVLCPSNFDPNKAPLVRPFTAILVRVKTGGVCMISVYAGSARLSFRQYEQTIFHRTVGKPSSPDAKVNCVASVPSAFITKISGFPPVLGRNDIK